MSIFLGIVQGVAEFLPISSSGHLSILQNFMNLNYDESNHLLFDVLLHLGTLVSVCIVYWKEIVSMFFETIGFLKGDSNNGRTADGRLSPSVRMVLMIIIGTLPLIIALPFYGKVEQLYYTTPFIGFALIITGTLLYISDKLLDGNKNEKNITIANALIIGLSQAVAILPGLSRSGTTITVGVSCGLKRDFAVKFSFLLSIPAVIGSVLVSLVDALRAGINWSLLPVYLVGMITASVTGYFAIKLVKYLVSKTKFGKFSYYCWGVGVLTLFLSIIL